jgi:ankyrin repeat protein
MQEGVKFTVKDDHENTCLVLAVKANKGDCVVSILERVANDPVLTPVEKQFFFNAQNNEGNTAMHEAVLRDYQTITQKLESFGRNLGWDASLKNKKGQTIDSIRAGHEKAKIG